MLHFKHDFDRATKLDKFSNVYGYSSISFYSDIEWYRSKYKPVVSLKQESPAVKPNGSAGQSQS